MDITLIRGEAIEEMSKLPDNSIDLIYTDLPYGTTNNKWDSIIPLEPMWEQFHRIAKPTTPIVLHASQPFTSLLVNSNLSNFKYEIIWYKTIASGQLNVKRQPLRIHESLLVFYRKQCLYNEQLTLGQPYDMVRSGKYSSQTYNKQGTSEKHNDGFRHATSVVRISNPRIKGGHPTQKPLELAEYVIKTFSKENDVILDCCMGVGTSGHAAFLLKRNFIGVELDECYFNIAKNRIETLKHQKENQ